MKKFTANTLRTSLEDRLKAESKKTGADIQRLRRNVAFDRLIIRLFQMSSPPWALKGGYAMQLRTDSARTTKDVDLALRDTKVFSDDLGKRINAIREIIIQQASLDLGDFFQFKISPPQKELDAPPDGGARFHVEVTLADRSFEKFHLDVGAGDVWSDPLELLDSSDALSFAGFKSQKLPAIPKEQQFAEKLHAYSLPRLDGRPNSRAKDLIDMNLLMDSSLDKSKLKSVIQETFAKRNTHAFSMDIEKPPESWQTLYPKLAEECNLDPSLENGFSKLKEFLKSL
jgi:hypothetical protein